jgi:hypothetical protein
VAQAVERLLCKHEVLSSDSSSTKKETKNSNSRLEAVAYAYILATQELEMEGLQFESSLGKPSDPCMVAQVCHPSSKGATKRRTTVQDVQT